MTYHEKQPKQKFKHGIEIIVDEAKSAAKSVIRRAGAESFSENLRETLDNVLSSRENVVMVRLNQDSLARLNDLVEANIVHSRSEAAAFMIGEGIKRRHALFDRIGEKIENIRKVKEELRTLLIEEGEPVGAASINDGSK